MASQYKTNSLTDLLKNIEECHLLFSFGLLEQNYSSVRCGSHWDGSLQNRLGDERTYGTTLASAYVLHRLSTAWSQLQMKERKSEWE